MRVRSGLLLLAANLLALALAVPVFSQPADDIIVNNAEETWQTTVHSNSALQDALRELAPRVALRYANELRHLDLVAPASSLQAALEELTDRVGIRYANANAQEPLVYPRELLDDSAAPRISAIEVRPAGDESVRILWLTDEFATSRVRYGADPGKYTETVSDTLYVKEHEVALTDLRPEVTYYYQVRSTDQSGNTAASSEGVFATTYSVYLPLVTRRQ